MARQATRKQPTRTRARTAPTVVPQAQPQPEEKPFVSTIANISLRPTTKKNYDDMSRSKKVIVRKSTYFLVNDVVRKLFVEQDGWFYEGHVSDTDRTELIQDGEPTPVYSSIFFTLEANDNDKKE